MRLPVDVFCDWLIGIKHGSRRYDDEYGYYYDDDNDDDEPAQIEDLDIGDWLICDYRKFKIIDIDADNWTAKIQWFSSNKIETVDENFINKCYHL